MREVPIVTTIAAALVVAAAGAARAEDPAPRSIAGKCAREVGGYYDPAKKLWMVPSRLVAAKNACVARMQKRGR